MVRWRVIALGVVVIATVAAPGTAMAATIIRTDHPIGHFAQDDRRLAWAFTCAEVQIHNLRTGISKTVSQLRCGDTQFAGVDGLALGGRALWRTLFDFPCSNFDGRVYTATPNRRQRRIDRHTFCSAFTADGDGRLLVYSRADLGGGGRTYRVTESGERMRLPGVAPTRKLAVSDGRLALVPRGGGNSVEIRDASSGALLTFFTPSDKILSVALGPTRTSVLLTDDAGARRIDWYDLSGTLVGSAKVREDAQSLDMAGPRVVYRTGHKIRLLDIRTQERTVISRPTSSPIGLSIEGRRVAWAQNRMGEGRIKRVIVS